MDPDSRRAVLLDAAVDYFDAHGIEVPLEAVAKAAGISPPLMRHYFKNRDGLMLAMFADRLMPELISIFSARGASPRQHLSAYLESVVRRPWAHHIWTAAINDLGRDPELRTTILNARLVLIERAAGKSRDQHEHNLRARADAFISVVEAAISRWLETQQPPADILIHDLLDIARRLGLPYG
jgi:AcrR family transcriptional regulator